MKKPSEWLNEIGELAMWEAFVGSNPPGSKMEELISRIQKDAQEGLTERKGIVPSVDEAGEESA